MPAFILEVLSATRPYLLTQPISWALPLPIAAAHALEVEGLNTGQYLLELTDPKKRLLQVRNFGPNRLVMLRCALAVLGTTLQQEQTSLANLLIDARTVLEDELPRFALVVEHLQDKESFLKRPLADVVRLPTIPTALLGEHSVHTVGHLLAADLTTVFPKYAHRQKFVERVRYQLARFGIVLDESRTNL